jgi:hypothetical protein
VALALQILNMSTPLDNPAITAETLEQEIEAWSEVPNAFVTTALREGKTLYAR